MRRRIPWDWLIVGGVLLFLAIAGGLHVARKDKAPAAKVTVGTSDQVYYARAATPVDARALGAALRGTGYFHDAGASVLLSKHNGTTDVLFAVDEGAWDHPGTVTAFEEIGRRIAATIGGFPIRVQLTDANWAVHKSFTVGKVLSGTHDVVYYFGSATEDEAIGLALSLTEAGYLGGSGASVGIWKNGATAIGFVVGDGMWNRPDAISGLEQLTRRVAKPLGGLPIDLRVLDSEMQTHKEVTVK